MNPMYEKLYTSYAEEILMEAQIYDEESIREFLSKLPLDEDTRYKLLSNFFLLFVQWTMDSFAIGLQMGLRLMSGPGIKG